MGLKHVPNDISAVHCRVTCDIPKIIMQTKLSDKRNHSVCTLLKWVNTSLFYVFRFCSIQHTRKRTTTFRNKQRKSPICNLCLCVTVLILVFVFFCIGNSTTTLETIEKFESNWLVCTQGHKIRKANIAFVTLCAIVVMAKRIAGSIKTPNR